MHHIECPCSTCVSQAWPEDALEMVAQKFLEDVEMQEAERTSVVVICKHFHESTRHTSERYMSTAPKHADRAR